MEAKSTPEGHSHISTYVSLAIVGSHGQSQLAGNLAEQISGFPEPLVRSKKEEGVEITIELANQLRLSKLVRERGQKKKNKRR